MTELKRRAAAMLDFIAQSQAEITRGETKGIAMGLERLTADNQSISSSISTGSDAAGLATELTTKLVKWQQEFTEEQAQAQAHAIAAVEATAAAK
jgi:hypothetical protein